MISSMRYNNLVYNYIVTYIIALIIIVNLAVGKLFKLYINRNYGDLLKS